MGCAGDWYIELSHYEKWQRNWCIIRLGQHPTLLGRLCMMKVNSWHNWSSPIHLMLCTLPCEGKNHKYVHPFILNFWQWLFFLMMGLWCKPFCRLNFQNLCWWYPFTTYWWDYESWGKWWCARLGNSWGLRKPNAWALLECMSFAFIRFVACKVNEVCIPDKIYSLFLHFQNINRTFCDFHVEAIV